MLLKYIGKDDSNVWKISGSKEIVKSGEVFKTSDKIGKQYLKGYKHLFTELIEPEVEIPIEPEIVEPKKTTKKTK